MGNQEREGALDRLDVVLRALPMHGDHRRRAEPGSLGVGCWRARASRSPTSFYSKPRRCHAHGMPRAGHDPGCSARAATSARCIADANASRRANLTSEILLELLTLITDATSGEESAARRRARVRLTPRIDGTRFPIVSAAIADIDARLSEGVERLADRSSILAEQLSPGIGQRCRNADRTESNRPHCFCSAPTTDPVCRSSHRACTGSTIAESYDVNRAEMGGAVDAIARRPE